MAFVGSGEKVFFKGTYDVNQFSTYNLDAGGASTFGFVDVKLKNVPRADRLTTSVYNVASVGQADVENAKVYLAEQYTVNTLNLAGQTKGQIMWAANYRNDDTITTTGGVQEFMVLGKSGLYSPITRVVIDFRRADGIRKIFFIGNM
jgi:hypothetical protein